MLYTSSHPNSNHMKGSLNKKFSPRTHRDICQTHVLLMVTVTDSFRYIDELLKFLLIIISQKGKFFEGENKDNYNYKRIPLSILYFRVQVNYNRCSCVPRHREWTKITSTRSWRNTRSFWFFSISVLREFLTRHKTLKGSGVVTPNRWVISKQHQ